MQSYLKIFFAVIVVFSICLEEALAHKDPEDGLTWFIDDAKTNTSFSKDTINTLKNISDNIALPEEKDSELITIGDDFEVDETILNSSEPQTVKNTGYNFEVKSVNLDQQSEEITDTERLISEGYKAIDLGQVAVAKEYFKKALRKNLRNIDALFGLASIYQQENQREEAMALYNEALEYEPDNSEILNNYLVLLSEESPDEAIKQLLKLEKVNKTLPVIPMQIGIIYASQQNFKKAIKYINRAILLDPENIMNVYNAAVILDEMGDYTQAVGYYKHAVSLSEDGKRLPTNLQNVKERIEYLNLKLG